jgi:hypothetical protein
VIDYENMRRVVVAGLKKHLNCPVIRSNQNEEKPSYPYVSYTVISLKGENNGTYGVYDDGTKRKPTTQTWSITVQSDDNSESVDLAVKAHEWLDDIGTVYLSDNGIAVQSVGNVGNRDNVITNNYEYRNGFDVVFVIESTIGSSETDTETIETVQINNSEYTKEPTEDELAEKLQRRLTGR